MFITTEGLKSLKTRKTMRNLKCPLSLLLRQKETLYFVSGMYVVYTVKLPNALKETIFILN